MKRQTQAELANELGSAVQRGLVAYRKCNTWVDEDDLRQEGWLAALQLARKPFVSRNADGSGFGGRAWSSVWRAMLAHVTTSIAPVSASNRGTERAKLREEKRSGTELEKHIIIDTVSDPEYLLVRDARTARVAARLDRLFDSHTVAMLLGEKRPNTRKEFLALHSAAMRVARDGVMRQIWEDM